MANYDIFNGDADGICALVQLRLAEPRKAVLITGVKRDINLLEKIIAKSGDHLTVLDISMRTNQVGLERALQLGANVFYVDHHNAGDISKHKNLQAVIDTRPTICTSLLVNKCLDGQYADWAIVGAYGDNLSVPAGLLADKIGMPKKTRLHLKTFGELINYNAYGSDISDLHYPPAALFEHMQIYATPQLFLRNNPDVYTRLKNGLDDDFTRAQKSQALAYNVKLLDDAPWARRVSGYYANWLASKTPDTAHATLTHNNKGGHTVSVRAPLNQLRGADTLCLQFPTGGGRAGAAGINHLPKEDVGKFIAAFNEAF